MKSSLILLPQNVKSFLQPYSGLRSQPSLGLKCTGKTGPKATYFLVTCNPRGSLLVSMHHKINSLSLFAFSTDIDFYSLHSIKKALGKD